MKKMLLLISFSLFLINKQNSPPDIYAVKLNRVAEKYITLGLTIGQYDADFVDAYYGPDSLKPIRPKSVRFPKDSLLKEVFNLQNDLNEIQLSAKDTDLNRAKWLSAQLLAYSRRIKIFSGSFASFDEESKELFGVVAPVFSKKYYEGVLAQIDSLLPGKDPIDKRFHKLAVKFIVPKDKVDLVVRATIAEARKQTLVHYNLPATENFTIEYVTKKPWSGYNWYKGNYKSVVQINTDFPMTIARVFEVGSHESYPGHHVYNMLMEKKLYRDKGRVELSIYPLFTPQSLIAEGSANYGVELAFPMNEKIAFAKKVLLPIAGLDTTGITIYLKAVEAINKMNYVDNDVARGILSGSMTKAKALVILGMGEAEGENEISFLKKYRSYIINYNVGQDIVKNYIEGKSAKTHTATDRWKLFGDLLSNQILITDLLKN